MISKKLIWIILFLIIILASVLRLWQLGNVPPSPDWDEVALGYNAYSIIHTGRDEFGKLLPVVLRSFDDYKPALYAYLTIPSVLLFGLNTFAVRLPSAIFGIISVLAVFLLIREIFEKYKYKDALSLTVAFLLAISPWSIQFSRVGFESNVGAALNLLMVLFFVKGLKKPILLSLSAIFAGLSIYVYQSEKVFTPLLALSLVLIFRKQLFSLSRKYIVSAFVVGLIVVIPMTFYILNDRGALLRVTGTSIFSYQTEILGGTISKLEKDRQNNDTLGLILDNRRVVYAKNIVSGYISHFSPNWLFITGDIARHHAPNMGLMYLFEFPFLLLGLYFLTFGNFDKKTKLLVLSWFLIAPIPASITTGVPHAVRTLNFLPTFQIITALGFISAFVFINKYKNLKWIFYLCVFVVFIFNFSYYLNQYFVQLNYHDSFDWQYGYKEAVDEVKKVGGNFNQIVISDKQPMDKSYMFFAFYLKYSPDKYQQESKDQSGGFAQHHYFDKYTFRPIDWPSDSTKSGTLYVTTADEIPEKVNGVKTIYNLNGKPAIKIVGIKNEINLK
jgi:4-amino-4-deoxy-L-arabinose transferase-like glycosyltransferase